MTIHPDFTALQGRPSSRAPLRQIAAAATERISDAAQRGIDDGDIELRRATAEAHGSRYQQSLERSVRMHLYSIP